MAPTNFAQAGPARDSTDDTGFEVWRMCVKQTGRIVRSAGSAWIAAAITALALCAAGCRARTTDSAPSAVAQTQTASTPEDSARKLGAAGTSIVSACAKVPYANASKGLIVTETGLNEDVFDLRDRSTYRAVPFSLNEALRLQDLLLKEIDAPNHARYSAQQIACIQQFAAHFKSLTDPLVEADAEQKQLDISAFDKASREAVQETDQEQKAITPRDSDRQ